VAVGSRKPAIRGRQSWRPAEDPVSQYSDMSCSVDRIACEMNAHIRSLKIIPEGKSSNKLEIFSLARYAIPFH